MHSKILSKQCETWSKGHIQVDSSFMFFWWYFGIHADQHIIWLSIYHHHHHYLSKTCKVAFKKFQLILANFNVHLQKWAMQCSVEVDKSELINQGIYSFENDFNGVQWRSLKTGYKVEHPCNILLHNKVGKTALKRHIIETAGELLGWKGMPSLTHSAAAAASATYLTLSQSTPASPDPAPCCSIILCQECQELQHHTLLQEKSRYSSKALCSISISSIRNFSCIKSIGIGISIIGIRSIRFLQGKVKTHFTEWIFKSWQENWKYSFAQQEPLWESCWAELREERGTQSRLLRKFS